MEQKLSNVITTNLNKNQELIYELKLCITQEIKLLHNILNYIYDYMYNLIKNDNIIFKNHIISQDIFSLSINLCADTTQMEISFIFNNTENYKNIIKELCNNNIKNFTNIIKKYKNFNSFIYICMLYKTKGKNFKIILTNVTNSIINNNIISIIQISFKYEIFLTENDKEKLINFMSLEDAFEIEQTFQKNEHKEKLILELD